MRQRWKCLHCKEEIVSVSLLKMCPACGRIGTLVRATTGQAPSQRD